MKITRIIATSVLCSLALFAVAQETFTLRRLFTEGQLDKYKVGVLIDQEVDASAFGGQPQVMKIDSSMTMTYRTVKHDKEKNIADMEIKVSDIDTKMDIPQGGPSMGDMPKEYTVKGKLNAMNQFSDIKIEGLPAAMMMMSGTAMSQQLNVVSFPEQAIKIGDSWDLKWPKNPMFGDSEPNLKAKLLGSKDYEGLQAYEISIKGVINVKIDPSEMVKSTGGEPAEMGPMGNMKMLITGTVDTDAVVLLEKGTGRLLSVDGKGDSNMKLDLSDMGVTLPIKGRTTSVMKLVVKKS